MPIYRRHSDVYPRILNGSPAYGGASKRTVASRYHAFVSAAHSALADGTSTIHHSNR
ncbi:hypothetical protein FP2506_10051 [Fulvimarina pelagi HTCC2506]|uniref:Uncharacterized protein n=1 Tax=Fulvimarina pelagi HTCC2506 TaxID=314231 RepID=Q0G586_9HYPH|nr:hypothetical protein FP2506_10051 [Fulvimarina pelagi HTCC2506]